MTDKRRGLGRGLGALIPTAPETAPAGTRPSDVFFGGAPAPGEHLSPGGGTASEPGVTNGASDAQQPATPRVAKGQSLDATSDVVAGDAALRASGEGAGEPESALAPVPGATFAEIPLAAIRANPRQPRSAFDEDDLAELTHSVREIGILQPIVVRAIPPTDGVTHEIVMGERRWRAARDAGLEVVPAIVRSTDDDAMLRDALLENLHRSDLNPLEEAAAYQQLLDDFGCTHEELAGRIGRSRPQITNTLRLLRLPPLVARRVAAGVLSAGHARALLGLSDGAAMERLAQRIVAEGLSVRAVEELVALGDADEPVRDRAPRVTRSNPDLDDLAVRLGDRLDTRVSIAMGKSKGKLTVEFASREDLDRILSGLAHLDTL